MPLCIPGTPVEFNLLQPPQPPYSTSRESETNMTTIASIAAAYRGYYATLELERREPTAKHKLDTREMWARFGALKEQTAAELARLNGWRAAPRSRASTAWLGRGAAFRAPSHSYDPAFDHPLVFSKDRRVAAIVGQPYGHIDVAKVKVALAEQGYALHTPPDPFASIYYPGGTLFLVVTLPETAVRFLPDQDGDWRRLSAVEQAPRGEAA